MKIFNTMSRKKEDFKPVSNPVGIYICGPTVYDYAHIGNLRSYVFSDILRRVILLNNFKLNSVMNITDVGHLVSDADEGEDKLVKALRREGKPLTKESLLELSEIYAEAFKEDISSLNITFPDVWCKATEHVEDMIKVIEKIIKNGFAYETGTAIYFDTSKDKDYGKLARLKLEELKAGARVEVDKEKKNPRDFVLWFKLAGKNKNHVMFWDSPWGKGFPGWHIECSAMSSKYLGEQFDIHCGGIDHIPVHHVNEIAQSEAAFGKKPWVKYWVHNEFLVLDKGKMSKSEGSFIILKDLINKGYSPLDYRYLCLGTHYRKQLYFSFEALDNARNSLERLRNIVSELKHEDGESSGSGEKYKKEFFEAVSDDLNTPEGLAILWSALRDSSLGAREKLEVAEYCDKVLGLDLMKEEEIPAEIVRLAEKREKARAEKDYREADRLREAIKEKGYVVEDKKEGFVLKKL